jgi:hypothetical protein
MVRGLDVFKAHFSSYVDQYLLIGGTACEVVMSEVGLDFRATKDLDIVLCIEAIDSAFVRAFWEFVRAGGYHQQEGDSDRRQYYRFRHPTAPDFPLLRSTTGCRRCNTPPKPQAESRTTNETV